MTTPVQIFVRDANLKLLGQIEDFQQLTVTLKYNDVGTWELTLPASSPGAMLLDRTANPGGGVLLMRNGVQLLSGPARGHKWSRSGDTGDGVMTVVGLDDAWVLSSHLVWPNPTKAIDDATMPIWYAMVPSAIPAETLMRNLVLGQMGPGVANGRGISNLTSDPNLGRGLSQLAPKWRFNSVLDALQQMSVLSKAGTDPKAELGFSVDQVATNLQFSVFLSNDRSGTVRFSFNIGNLAEAQYTTTAPQATNLISGAGQQTDTGSNARVNSQLFGYSRTDGYYPGFYSEGFLDAGEVDPLDVNAVAQLQQQVDDYWAASGGQVAATFKALDTTTMAFGTHYMLGDFVTVELPQLTIVERVRQVGLTYTADAGEELSLAVGTADGTYGRLTSGHTSAAMLNAYVAKARSNYEALKAKQAAADAASKAHQAHLAHKAHQLHAAHVKNKRIGQTKKKTEGRGPRK